MSYPFNNNFPLQPDPYNSRIETQVNSNKNYQFVGFLGGRVLQASELNEIQEQFYVQQTLMTEWLNNWWGKSGITGPSWQGATPLNPNLLDRTTGTSTITLSPGWLLIRTPSLMGGLAVWIYNTSTFTFNPVTSSTQTYGLAAKIEYVTNDSSLNDNTGGRTVFGTEPVQGAHRVKVTFDTTTYTEGTVPSDYIYLSVIKTDGSDKITTINNYEIT